MWHGYWHLKFNNSNPTGLQTLRNNINLFGTHDRDLPHENTAIRKSLDGMECIGESCLESEIILANITVPISSFLSITVQEAENMIDNFTIFNGIDWEERRKAAVSFLITNKANWEEEE